jgi:ABC-type polysaccharide/polyol phosphate export permease
MYMRIFLTQLFLGAKLYLRSPIDLFWMVFFPISLLVCLGALLGGRADAPQKLVWMRAAAATEADERFARALAECGLQVEVLSSVAAEARWVTGKLPAMLEGNSGHYRLRIDPYYRAQGHQIEADVQQGYLRAALTSAAGGTPPARVPVVETGPSGHTDARYVAYLLPGLLGFNLMAMGVFNTGIADVATRAKGGYRRLAVTPAPRPIYLAAQLAVRLLVVIVSATLLILVGFLFFGVRSHGDYLSLAALIVLGTACFTSMGFVLASFAGTVNAYDGVANSVFIPMMLLSGVYFSLDGAPAWLQLGADVLPLAALLKALRAVFTDGADLRSQGSLIGLVCGWAAAFFVLAVKRFRWV